MEEMNEQKSNEVLEELNQKAKEDLANAEHIEYGDDKESVECVTKLKAQIENMVNNTQTQLDAINSAQAKNKQFVDFFESCLKNKELDDNIKSLIADNLKNLAKALDENEKNRGVIENANKNSVAVLRDLDYTLINGKAYFNKVAIDFAKFILNN